MDIFIYALIDPRTGNPFYVGKTNNPQIRLKAHRTGAGKTRCAEYIREIRAAGLRITLDVLQTCSHLEWEHAEREWILKMSQQFQLANVSDGGQPGYFSPHSQLTRQRMREKFLGRPIPPEQRAKISAALTGLKQSPETIQKRLQTWTNRRIENGLDPLGTYHEREILKRREQRKAHGIMVHGSEEYRRNAAEKTAARYASLTDEEKREFSEKRKGRANPNKGKKFGPLSAEHRARLSQIHKDRIAAMTPEQRKARAENSVGARWKKRQT
jgi:predicted GIY-YIG superfamily endonuclease